MRRAPCNKCRSGKQSEGDSWCLGCSSLEVGQQLLKRQWHSAGLRAVAEEAALSAARFIRALSNVDSSTFQAGPGSSGLSTAAKSKAERPRSRSPPQDERPPLVRQPPSREPSRAERHPSPERPDRDRGRESDYTYTDGEGEEEEEVTREVKAEEKEAPKRDRRGAERSRRGSEKPPEPPAPPPREGKKRKRKGKRGGTKHQRHYRERDQPFKVSHRRLSHHQLELAPNLQEGWERRAWVSSLGL